MLEDIREIALLELLEPRKGKTSRFKALLGYKDKKTNTPHILVVNKNARGSTSREVKVLNEKRSTFLDNSRHSTKDSKKDEKKIKPWDSS